MLLQPPATCSRFIHLIPVHHHLPGRCPLVRLTALSTSGAMLPRQRSRRRKTTGELGGVIGQQCWREGKQHQQPCMLVKHVSSIPCTQSLNDYKLSSMPVSDPFYPDICALTCVRHAVAASVGCSACLPTTTPTLSSMPTEVGAASLLHQIWRRIQFKMHQDALVS